VQVQLFAVRIQASGGFGLLSLAVPEAVILGDVDVLPTGRACLGLAAGPRAGREPLLRERRCPLRQQCLSRDEKAVHSPRLKLARGDLKVASRLLCKEGKKLLSWETPT